MLKGTVRLFKVAGIPVQIHTSWILVFILVTWNLTGALFPQRYPGASPVLYVAAGVAGSLLFFASVLVHELCHSIVARSRGLPVRDITLFIFGGVSEITDEPETPKTEFLMALAGPAASLLMGIVLLVLSAAMGTGNQLLGVMSRYLGQINLSLGVFNLIPGFPLDGGRVLRSILWSRSQDLARATRTASLVGQGIAYLFIVAGVWQLFTGQFVNGIWIAFIGWFLDNAAQSSMRQTAVKAMLAGHTVREVMTQDCYTLPPSLHLDELVNQHILGTGRRCFPIVDNGDLLGLLTLHNIRGVPQARWHDVTTQEAMTPVSQLQSIGPDDGLWAAMEEMTEDGVNQLPVMERGRLVGMLGRDNLLSFIRVRAELGV